MPNHRLLPVVVLLVAAWSTPAAAQPPATEPPPPATTPPAPPPAATVPPAATAPSPEATPPPAPATAAPPAPPPAAPPAPPRRPDDKWWETYEPRPRSSAKIPLVVTGSGLAGLGVLTLFAAGITWLTAAGHASQLDCDGGGLDEYEWERCCPHGNCVKGTSGGDAYESAKDLSAASEVLVAIAFPMIGVGASLAILGGTIRGGGDRRVGLKATPTGVVLEGQF